MRTTYVPNTRPVPIANRDRNSPYCFKGFTQRKWIALVGIVFAEKYRVALYASELQAANLANPGSIPPATLVAAGSIPETWANAFTQNANGDRMILVDTFYGMLSHILHDLSLSLVDVKAATSWANGSPQYLSHGEINELLACFQAK